MSQLDFLCSKHLYFIKILFSSILSIFELNIYSLVGNKLLTGSFQETMKKKGNKEDEVGLYK